MRYYNVKFFIRVLSSTLLHNNFARLYYSKITCLDLLLLALLFFIIFLILNLLFRTIKELNYTIFVLFLQNVEFFKSFELVIIFKRKKF